MAETLEFRGAIVVTEDAVKRLVARLRSITPQEQFSGVVQSERGVSHLFDNSNLELISTVENTKSASIRSISVRGIDLTRKLHVLMANEDPAFMVSWGDVEDDLRNKLHSLYLEESRNLRSFYWMATVFFTWLYSGWRLAVLAVLSLAYLIWLAIVLFTTASVSVEAKSASGAAGPGLSILLRLLFWTALGILLAVITSRLFPRAVFAIREGIHRYDIILRWRFLLFASLILPLIITSVLKLYERLA